jgi:hypothetical protein
MNITLNIFSCALIIQEDVSFHGYQKHIVSAAAPGPMSREELEREEVKTQTNVEVSVDSKQQTMSGIAFPLTAAAKEAIQSFKDELTNYVQLSIDTAKEIVNVENKSSCDLKSLPSKVPEDAPRYHVFRFDHTHEGDFLKSTSNSSKSSIIGKKINRSKVVHIYDVERGWSGANEHNTQQNSNI